MSTNNEGALGKLSLAWPESCPVCAASFESGGRLLVYVARGVSTCNTTNGKLSALAARKTKTPIALCRECGIHVTAEVGAQDRVQPALDALRDSANLAFPERSAVEKPVDAVSLASTVGVEGLKEAGDKIGKSMREALDGFLPAIEQPNKELDLGDFKLPGQIEQEGAE